MIPKLVIVIWLILCTSWNFSYSLTIARATLEELTSESELIIYARVAISECRWEDEARKIISTFAELETIEVIKGQNLAEVTVKQLGGQIDEWGMVISGTPYLQRGDEAIFFLVPRGEYYEIHSIALGLFRIYVDENGLQKVVNDLGNINLIDPLTKSEVVPDEKIQTFELHPFISQIRSYSLKE